MKTFKQFLKEASPTKSDGSNPQGFSSDATATGPVAGYDPYLFPKSVDDLLSQDYQTPGESGMAKYRFASIYPVEKLTMAGIDNMMKAGKEYTELMNQHTADVVKRNFTRFMGYTK